VAALLFAGDAPKGALRTPDAAAQAFKLRDLTAKSEPVYVKSDWERELELRYKGARSLADYRKMASVIVNPAQSVLQEGPVCKHGCNIYRTAGFEKGVSDGQRVRRVSEGG
jgi:hypothetical protein